MSKKYISVSHYALNDISQYLREIEDKKESPAYEVWYVCPKHLNTKETRMLNRELGLHRLNGRIENTHKKKG